MRQCWTMQMDARLRERLGAGDTAAEAGRALGMTRNAVIGRAGRLKIRIGRVGDPSAPGTERPVAAGLVSDGEPARCVQSAPDPAASIRLERERARRRAWADRKASGGAPAEHIAREPAAAPSTREPMTLLDERFRQGRHCRWPVGEVEDVPGRHLFCAADVPAFGDVYCGCHAIESRALAATAAARNAAAAKFTEEAARQGRKVAASAAKRSTGRMFA